ncbi:MAG: 4Fe-4S ferredoxin [Oscillospiraceae bacterium]
MRGYQLVRGCGCRNGFCGACATLYRVKVRQELKTCLACQTQVEEGMYVATLPFFPLVKQVYDMDKIPLNQQVMMQLYPEIYACIGCNACTKSCTQELNVMQYIAYAQRGTLLPAQRSPLTASCAGYAPPVARRAFPTPGGHAGPADQRQVSDAQVPAPGGPGGEIADGTFRELMESSDGQALGRAARAVQPPGH